VSGGGNNEASGNRANISGGRNNKALGNYSYVGGGGGTNYYDGNLAFANYSAILGGRTNGTGDVSRIYNSGGAYWELTPGTDHDIGIQSTVSSGYVNISSGTYAGISGGRGNIASGDSASINGGQSNVAGGDSSSISGGHNRSVSGAYDWSAGSLFQDD